MTEEGCEMLALPGSPPGAPSVRVRWRRHPAARQAVLRPDPAGGIAVTLPPRVGRAAGLRLIARHAEWIRARLAALPAPAPLRDGATAPVNGIDHPIRHHPGLRGGDRIEAGEILVGGQSAFLPRRVIELLRREAARVLPPMVRDRARAIGLAPRRIVLRDTRGRWGSCSSSGAVMLSWRLLLAPPFVQEYVAAHEAAHLRHMHHGPDFHRLVDELTPHAAAGRRWLRAQGSGLLRVGAAPPEG